MSLRRLSWHALDASLWFQAVTIRSVLIHPAGYPPFCSENAHDVYRKIIDWRNHLYFPDDVHLSREAEDLIRRMLCEADRRLTCEQLKSHPVSRRGGGAVP